MSDESYGAFAYAYDQALGERFFRSLRRVLARLLQKFPSPEKTHLDLASGSGLATEYFAQLGYRSTGVDLSLPMLALAARRTPNRVAGDICRLPVRGTFGVVTSFYDSLNHLKTPASLLAAFTGARRVMSPRSIFIFDMNDPEIYPAVWGLDEPFVAEGKDFRLVMATRFNAKTRIAHADVRGYAIRNGKRVEIREEHRQRAYSREQIVKALDSAGLQPLEITGFDPYGESRRVKLVFVCRAREDAPRQSR